jgi:hypothetical protein
MPTLPIFNAQVGERPISGGRRAGADEFSGGAAALGGLASTASKAADAHLGRMEEEESRKALVAATEIRARYARELDQAQLNGGDLDKLKERMANELSAVGDGFQTRKGADSLQMHSSNTEIMFDEQANRIAVVRASSQARLDASKFMQGASSVLQSNPTYLGTATQDAEALIDTFQRVPPEKKAELKAELRQNLNMAAALASARIDPEGTKKRLEAGEWELSAEQRNLAVNKTDEQMNARRASENHARSLAEFERKQRDEVATRKYVGEIVNGTLTGKALERAITADVDLDSASVRMLTLFAEHRANEMTQGSKKSHEPTRRDLWLAVHAPDGDPKKIYNNAAIVQAVEAGRLNTTDANALMAAVANQKDENNRSFGTRLQGRIGTVSAAMRVSPEFAAQPELAAAIQLEMVAQVEKRAGELRAANKDPSGLLDPESKDYYFKPGIIKTVADDVKRRRLDALPPVPAPKTQAEYDALPVGATYVDSDGQTKVKKERRKAAGSPPEPISERRRAQRGSQEPLFLSAPSPVSGL